MTLGKEVECLAISPNVEWFVQYLNFTHYTFLQDQIIDIKSPKPTALNFFSNGDEPSETSRLQQPVKLQPSWEENNLPEDELNFKSLTMDQASLEVHAPRDRWNLIYIVFLVHGIGTLTPWNMFITAGDYFTTYKLSESYIHYVFPYVSNFIQILTFCAQVPNVAFNWLNIFVRIGGGELTTRIVYSISTIVVCFLVTVFLAMIDTSTWPEPFFWITLCCVVIMNMAIGVYQNTVFGMAAKLPGKYTGAIILGNNICGTLVSLLSMLTIFLSDDQRMAAIYYFITALFVLFICFDTYFALPLNRYYRHHDLKAKKLALEQSNAIGSTEKIPYLKVMKQSKIQLYNVFCVLFVTLCVFPSIQSNVQPKEDFFIKQPYFTQVTCFLTFNFFAMLGSLLATMVKWPKPKFLWIPVSLRLLYIPYYIFTNYQVPEQKRLLPVYFEDDLVYWVISITFAVGSGYLTSLAMTFTPQCVEPKYASTAGMLAGAFLITGIFGGILVSFLWPWAVTHIGY